MWPVFALLSQCIAVLMTSGPYVCVSVQMWHSVHIIGFLGYTLFAIVHYAGMWVAFVPGEPQVNLPCPALPCTALC